jgi:protein involved in polysaccharide export with SLBB domain
MRFFVRPVDAMVVVALVCLASAGVAQAPVRGDAGHANATRQELERLAQQSTGAMSESIRTRLRDGDFRAGDRIVLVVQGDSTLNDTVVVADGPTLKVLSLPEDSLRGVLRSELQPHLSAWVTRFYKNATVKATPLIRFGVLGEVNRPGYYRLPINVAVTDAIMSAGGPTQRADIPKTVVRRRSQELLSKGAVRDAMVGGLTLEQLGLDAGDELVVGAKRERQWMNIVQIATLVTGLAISVRASRGF